MTLLKVRILPLWCLSVSRFPKGLFTFGKMYAIQEPKINYIFSLSLQGWRNLRKKLTKLLMDRMTTLGLDSCTNSSVTAWELMDQALMTKILEAKRVWNLQSWMKHGAWRTFTNFTKMRMVSLAIFMVFVFKITSVYNTNYSSNFK